MESRTYTASCLAKLGESGPAGCDLYTVMDGSYRLPRHELPSCELIVVPAAVIYNKCTQPTVMTEITYARQTEGPALHVLTAHWFTAQAEKEMDSLQKNHRIGKRKLCTAKPF